MKLIGTAFFDLMALKKPMSVGFLFFIVPNDRYNSKVTAREFDKKYSKYWTAEVLMNNKLYLKPKK